MRFATWACVALLAILSLTPGKVMPRTGLPGHTEHFIAYAATSLIATAAYGRRGHHWARVTGLLAIYAGILESLQNFSPGRHPAVSDFLFSVAGDVCGGLALLVLCHVSVHTLRLRWTGGP